MKEKQCENCKYYVRHYGLYNGKINRIYCGHCTHDKIRTKKPGQKACGKFEYGIQAEETFVDKEYLSKKLLNYLLQLDLLPQIDDFPVDKQ